MTLDGKYPGIALGGEGTDGDGYTRLNIFVVDGREYFIGTVGADRNKAEKFISSFHLLNSPGGGKPATSGHVADASGQGPSNDSGNGSSVFGNQGANEQNSPEVNVEELGTPEQSLPLHSHPSWSVLWLTQEEEPDEDPDFQSLAPNGGYLVGLIATESRWSHVPVVGSLQPVYQVDDRYVLGERFGEAKGKTIRVLAEPGYVLGGVKARKARNLDGLQLVFMKLENGQLIRSNFIQSRWIGNSTGGSPFALDGSKGILVGIRGDLLDSGEVGSIELAYIGEDPTEVETTGTEEKAFSSSGGGDSGEDAPGGNGAENTIAEPAEGEELDKADVAGMSKPVGHDRGTPYRDIAPEGAIMTGLQVTYGLWMGRDRFLGSLQPLYQTADGKYVKGEVHGKERLDQKGNAVAKPGYAVGGLAVRTGLKINAIQVIFMKKKANGRLDPNDTYTSEWFGTETGGGPVVLEGKGYPVIGIQGGYQEDVNGIQLVFGK
jgi:hypothetical protein